MPAALVVEDHPDLRYLFGLVLDMAGWQVWKASGFAQAVDLACSRQPDVVVTDYAMPGGSGMDLARELRSHPDSSRTPILMVTGQPMELREHLVDGVVPHVCAIIVKPVASDELEDTATALHQLCRDGCAGLGLHAACTTGFRSGGCGKVPLK